jgi:transcriptional regulator with XRE-family HTH domain
MSDTAFGRFLFQHRTARNWSMSELSRRSGLSQPEVSRIESGQRLPTLRHVKGVSEAFSASPIEGANEPKYYADWLVRFVDVAERTRQGARVAPGRWAKRKAAGQE